MTSLIKATPATQTAPPSNNVTKGGGKSRSVAGALSARSVCKTLLVYLGGEGCQSLLPFICNNMQIC